MPDHQIPGRFIRFMGQVHGPDGAAWARDLPQLIAQFADEWELEILGPTGPLSYNYILAATSTDGTPVILKLGYPPKDLVGEIRALRHFDGHGICQLLRADEQRGAMLLERLMPGMTLRELPDDDEATQIAATVMQHLWTAPDGTGGLIRVEDWEKGFSRLRKRFGGGTGSLPADFVAEAEAIYRDLLADPAGEPAVLHGDLHHENILSAQRQPWLAIDPKGVIGEPAYEVGALIRNPIPEVASWPDLEQRLDRRLSILAEQLGMDRERLRLWSFAQAMLAAWWDIEDNTETEAVHLCIAEALHDLNPRGRSAPR